jgi:hypothetical protein
MKKVVAGMDLHSNNVVIGIVDLDGKRVAKTSNVQLTGAHRSATEKCQAPGIQGFWQKWPNWEGNSELGHYAEV